VYAVTGPAVAPQRRCDGAHLGRYAGYGVTVRCTFSACVVETGNGVTEETANSLGSGVLVSACGAFVAVLRDHAEIVRAHADRQSPKPPARSFPVRSHSLGRCRHGGLPPSRDGARKTVPKA
jgi:hypothetical protein